MARSGDLLAGALLGAGLAYYLDPDRGRRRRALLRDHVVHLGHEVKGAAGPTSRDLANRTLGLMHEAKGRVLNGDADDVVLVARVRSALGRLVSHPGSVEVRSEHGRVTLSGPVLAAELDRLLAGVEHVPGVHDVVNRLEVHAAAGNVPGLQGQARPRGARAELLQRNWAPATRFLAGLVGGSLMLRGLLSGGSVNRAMGTLGAAILTRATTNLDAARLTGIGAGHRAVDIDRTIHIPAPVEEVFSFWRNFENLPLFMSHLSEVVVMDEGRSQWTAAGPGGVPIRWEAELTRLVANECIAWESLPGALVQNAGVVRFDPAPHGGTRVHIQLSYNPPAGAIGHALLAALGRDPERMLTRDLVRLQGLFADGRTRAHGRLMLREEAES
jgi:uncharacterized membrane protein